MLRKNATGAVFKKVVFVKVLSGFQSFAGGGGGGGGGRSSKVSEALFSSNIPHEWTFQ